MSNDAMNEEPLPWEIDLPETRPSPAPDSGSRRGRKAAGLPAKPDDADGDRGIVPNKTPRRYPDELKFELILESIRQQKTQNELSRQYGIPQSLISLWRKEALDVLRGHVGKPRTKPGRKTSSSNGIEELFQGEDVEAMFRLRDTLAQSIGMIDLFLKRVGKGKGGPGTD